MPEITETEYKTWFTATFGSSYYIWHDGLPTEVVTPLTGEARSQAVRMLLFGIQLKDGYAAEALGDMGETSALPYLRTALPNASEDSKVKIALAIKQLHGEDDPSTPAANLISVLDNRNTHWGPRINAAMGLRQFKSLESEEALLRAVELEDEYLVRYHSCESLLARWGVQPPSISLQKPIFALICDAQEDDVMKDKSERGRKAVGLLQELKSSVH